MPARRRVPQDYVLHFPTPAVWRHLSQSAELPPTWLEVRPTRRWREEDSNLRSRRGERPSARERRRGPLRGVAHGRHATVGRDEELALLQRRWQQAKGGEGRVVLVSGEPGIGKSRLAQTLLEEVADEAHTRLRLFWSPHHQDSALYPTITQLERAAGFRLEDTAEQRLDKLEAVLGQATSDL